MTHRRRHRYPARLLLLPLAVALCPGTAGGQLRPGIERGDYWGEIRARYRSEVLEGVGGTMESWLQAWNAGDLSGVLEAYGENGVLILGAEAHAGLDRIGTVLQELLPRFGPMQFGLQDFDVSGDMAFATTSFRLTERSGRSGSTRTTGHLVWILMKKNGSWRIRSQIFQQSEG